MTTTPLVNHAVIKPAAPVKAAPVAAPVTHVSVPITLLQSLHAQLSTHAEQIAALIPAVNTPEEIEAAAKVATALRLKQQAVQGK
jgi:hypothetical protein